MYVHYQSPFEDANKHGIFNFQVYKLKIERFPKDLFFVCLFFMGILHLLSSWFYYPSDTKHYRQYLHIR